MLKKYEICNFHQLKKKILLILSHATYNFKMMNLSINSLVKNVDFLIRKTRKMSRESFPKWFSFFSFSSVAEANGPKRSYFRLTRVKKTKITIAITIIASKSEKKNEGGRIKWYPLFLPGRKVDLADPRFRKCQISLPLSLSLICFRADINFRRRKFF